MAKIKLSELNRSEISRGTGYSLSHVSRVLSGKRMPSVVALGKIASYLGLTRDELCALLGVNGTKRPRNKK